MCSDESPAESFIHAHVEQYVKRDGGQVITRFPPEPNGYLHIGHAKAIVLNFDIAARYGGACHLRYDDTNPERESEEFMRSIREDIEWLGYRWDGQIRYASDYFPQLYEYARALVHAGRAYVDHQSSAEIRERRGTPTAAGVDSPYREQSVAENLEQLEKMRRGEYADGSCVLRAKIDMKHPNLNMRDPTMYRIRHQRHQRTGDEWAIYPLYDYAHGQSDAIEQVSHSLCTLEFENHRPLYDWFLEAIGFPKRPQQIEFAPLSIGGTILSKRLLQQLITQRVVDGWDDPRLLTLRGMRRRGYPAPAIRAFCRSIGITKIQSTIDFAHLEHFVRDYLNAHARRVMVVLEPIKVIIENYPADRRETIMAIDNPEDAQSSTRPLLFTRELYIDAGDFMQVPPKKYFRLSPGREVRLKHAYYITCTRVQHDATGGIQALICRYDPQSAGGTTPDKRKVAGTLHWVNAADAVPIAIRNYEPLFACADPTERLHNGEELRTLINPHSFAVHSGALAEPVLAAARGDVFYQFLRHGYYVLDAAATTDSAVPVFNRTVTLRDSWKKIQQHAATASAGT